MGEPASLAREIRDHLEREVLQRWFPRCLDRSGGGFHEHFARDWTGESTELKSLVFQSRMTYTAALWAAHVPNHTHQPATIARDGIRFLREAFWDPVDGGLFWDTTRTGEKHAYGQAFGVLAAAAVYGATGDEDALDLARDTFSWLEDRARDPVNGGYVEALSSAGEWMLEPTGQMETDRIGTRYGLKSSNTHLHLLEAYQELFEVWSDPDLRERLEALVRLHTDVLPQAPGFVPRYFHRDWSSADATASFGHDLETACLVLSGAEVLGAPRDGPHQDLAVDLIRHSMDHGWDGRYGGFYLEGPPGGKATRREKIWWVQAEALHLFGAYFSRGELFPKNHEKTLKRTWDFIRKRIADKRHGGWFGTVSRSGRRRLDRRKAHPWKAAYHETRALVKAAAGLSGSG